MDTGKNLKFIFFALMAWGEGISGGDKISIEFARRWSARFPVTIYLWEEGYRMYLRQGIDPKKIDFKVVNMNPWRNFGVLINYFARIIAGVVIAFKIDIQDKENTIIYSATEFWMDSLPGLILKLRYPGVRWVTTWFQTAPNPLKGFKEGNRMNSYRFTALGYWLVQLPVKHLISRWADFVLVNNEEERKQFPDMNNKGKVIVVLGAVDILKIKEILSGLKKITKEFDGVFQGRFHPQKGVIELIDIWKLVVEKKPDAKLALIGDGPLRKQVELRIEKLNLEKNVKLFGFVFDGLKKYRIFLQSKIVLHPAFYDSGGMASAEAMVLGLPAVGFNLDSYKSYYPEGMIKVPVGDLKAVSETVLELLRNKRLYSRIGNDAKTMIYKNWSWDERSQEVLKHFK